MWLIKSWFGRTKNKILLFLSLFLYKFEEEKTLFVKNEKQVFFEFSRKNLWKKKGNKFEKKNKKLNFYSLGKTPDPSIWFLKKFFVFLFFFVETFLNQKHIFLLSFVETLYFKRQLQNLKMMNEKFSKFFEKSTKFPKDNFFSFSKTWLFFIAFWKDFFFRRKSHFLLIWKNGSST